MKRDDSIDVSGSDLTDEQLVAGSTSPPINSRSVVVLIDAFDFPTLLPTQLFAVSTLALHTSPLRSRITGDPYIDRRGHRT
ncbi:MAG: hypothetical protein O6705_09670 [Actinobacteria bacterium]|nr:hypothetical protein [Actinomycetota bacterium]